AREAPEARQRQSAGGAQEHRRGGGERGDQEAALHGVEQLLVVHQRAVPAQREATPDRGHARGVERIHDHRKDRDVEEGVAGHHGRVQQRGTALHASASRSLRRFSKYSNRSVGSTISTSMAMVTAAASGQSRLVKNSIQSTRPMVSASGPPRMSGITNSPTAGMNTSSAPAMMPGIDSGSVTRAKACQGLAPRSSAASSRVKSSRIRVAVSGRIMNGR